MQYKNSWVSSLVLHHKKWSLAETSKEVFPYAKQHIKAYLSYLGKPLLLSKTVHLRHSHQWFGIQIWCFKTNNQIIEQLTAHCIAHCSLSFFTSFRPPPPLFFPLHQICSFFFFRTLVWCEVPTIVVHSLRSPVEARWAGCRNH